MAVEQNMGDSSDKPDVVPVEDKNSNDFSQSDVSSQKKDNKIFKSKNSLIGVVIIAVIAIIFVSVIAFTSMSTVSDSGEVTGSLNLAKSHSPAFVDTIYGLEFNIPEGYETFDGTDNQKNGTLTTYYRTYQGDDGNMITISVSTSQGSFDWDLSLNRHYDDVDKTVNGFEGVLESDGTFTYVNGDKLVIIIGADESQLESIIR